MHPYIPNSAEDKQKMLSDLGLSSDEPLFADIPESLRLKGGIPIAKGLPEMQVLGELQKLADMNTDATELPCFLGSGAYDSFIPSAVRHITGRSEFYTSYTPYQPEISQGTLQAIFEYQTMICELTGMDVSNASMYDGASACAEGAMMATHINGRQKIVVSKGVHPETRQVLATYARFQGKELVEVPLKDGVTDMAALAELADDATAAVIVQNPNFLGYIEAVTEAGQLIHDKKGLLIVSISDALSLALLKTPAECGADIVVGEGQSFGSGLSFGGPYLGFMATTTKNVRKMPGRICGQSVDMEGKRSFVLTLQAREQHIRRDKANSNICSNQGLIALTTTAYLTLMGKEGLREAARQSLSKARYLQSALKAVGLEPVADRPYFREFPVKLPKSSDAVTKALLEAGFIGGMGLDGAYPELGAAMVFCTTEKRTRAEIDGLAAALKAIVEA